MAAACAWEFPHHAIWRCVAAKSPLPSRRPEDRREPRSGGANGRWNMNAQPFIDRETGECEVYSWSAPAVAEADPPRRLERHAIARLSDAQIESMDRDWLIELVRTSPHPWNDMDMQPHLEFADRCSLVRLALLAR